MAVALAVALADAARVRWLLEVASMSGVVTTTTAPDGAEVLVFGDDTWVLEVEWGSVLNPRFLIHRPSVSVVADGDYCYDVRIAATDGPGYTGPAQAAKSVVPTRWLVETDGDETTLILVGRLDFGQTGPTDIAIEHVITLRGSEEALRERLSLVHQSGRDHHLVTSYRFAFRKWLFDRLHNLWVDGAEGIEIVPVPFRRRRGQRVDYGVDAYAVPDLVPSGFEDTPRLNRGSEAWLVQGNEAGTLIAKYCQTHIEFGVIDTEFVADAAYGRSHTPTHLGSVTHEASVSVGHLYLRFGGAAQIDNAPGFDLRLGPDGRLDFGTTLIERYDGSWQAGYATYKRLLGRRGHGLPSDYASSLHWNELYHLSWRVGTNTPLPSLEAVLAEASVASQSGAETFYFDPGWDLYEGSTVWDEARLGPLEEFVKLLDEQYSLKLGLHLMMHTKGLEEDHLDIYRRDRSGEIEIWEGSYSGGFVCAASPSWQRLKTQRLVRLAEAGVSFFMFDFLDYRLTEDFRDAPWRTEGCWSPDHAHANPCTLEQHIAGILAVVREVKKSHPHLIIELHDRVAGGLGDYLPLYLDHGSTDSFDEHWGFEYMWDPYMDLVSGRALSLYEYNLAYDIPLYLHINNAHDSETNLAFWWYASTCRHLGIGGVGPDTPRWQRFVDAVARYKALKPYFVRGTFVGLDPLSHLHVHIGEPSSAVLLVFNLTSEPVMRMVRIPLDQVAGVDVSNVVGGESNIDGNELTISVEIAALAPALVTIGVDP